MPGGRLRAPRTTFVAGFIGVSNLMPRDRPRGARRGASSTAGPRWHDAGGVERRASAVRGRAPREAGVELADESAPRHGRPASRGWSRARSTWARRRRCVVELGEDARMTVLVPNADEAERQRLPGGGAQVTLSWDPSTCTCVRGSLREAGRPSGRGARTTTGRGSSETEQDDAVRSPNRRGGRPRCATARCWPPAAGGGGRGRRGERPTSRRQGWRSGEPART